MWTQVFNIQTSKPVSRERREWLFGQFVQSGAGGGAGYGGGYGQAALAASQPSCKLNLANVSKDTFHKTESLKFIIIRSLF